MSSSAHASFLLLSRPSSNDNRVRRRLLLSRGKSCIGSSSMNFHRSSTSCALCCVGSMKASGKYAIHFLIAFSTRLRTILLF